jgi:hypothetical protein
MDKVAMIKQAYAYGAAVALQELGYDVNTAQNAGVKLAEDEEGMHPALRALIGTGAGIGGGALLGAGLGAGGAALSRRLGGPSLSEAAMRGTGKIEGTIPFGSAENHAKYNTNLLEKLMGKMPYQPAGQAEMGAMRPRQAYGDEAMMGAQLGGAGGAGLGALGGGLYGGLSE